MVDHISSRFGITEEVCQELICISLEIIGHHVNDKCMEVGDIVDEMKNRTMGMCHEDQIFVAYAIGSKVASLMVYTRNGISATTVLNDMIRMSKED